MAEKPVKVIQDSEKPIPDEVLASHIAAIGDAVSKLMAGPLKEDAIVLLIHDWSKVPRRDIKLVLSCLRQLKTIYLKS